MKNYLIETKKIYNRGITLISLIITIVVLLILAGVSLATLIGENGIITMAKQAKEETRGANVEEAKSIWEINQSRGFNNSTSSESVEELINRLVEDGLITQEEKEQILGNEEKGIEGTGQVTIGSRTIIFTKGSLTLVKMFEKAEADGCLNLDGKCNNEEHLHIGDYVDYNPGKTGSYTSYVAQNGMDYLDEWLSEEQRNQVFNVDDTTTWRVLGTDGENENKHILLISGSPIKKQTEVYNPYYYIHGARGYINAENELNNICGIYGNGNGAQSARSVKIEDINKACGVTVDETGIKPEGINHDATYGQTYSYTQQYATPEDYLSNTKSNFSKTSNNYYYYHDKFEAKMNQRLYEMLFNEVNNKKYYWLASKTVDASPDDVGFRLNSVRARGVGTGISLLVSDGTEPDVFDYGLAVRPVVVLKPDVTNNTINRIPDQIEEDWSRYEGGVTIPE